MYTITLFKTCFFIFWLIYQTKAKRESISIPYSECRRNFCFGFSPKNNDCVKKKNCKAFVIIKLDQTTGEELKTVFAFTAYMTDIKVENYAHWLGIGLSDDQHMGDDAVVDCFTVSTNNAGVRSSMNMVIRRTKINEYVSTDRVKGVHYGSKSFVDGTLTCEWIREKNSHIIGQDRDPDTNQLIGDLYNKTINFIDKSYYIMLAYGNLIPGSLSKQVHSPKQRSVGENKPFFNILFANCEQSLSITSKFCFGVDILKDGTMSSCLDMFRCMLSLTVTTIGNVNKFQARVSDVRRVSVDDDDFKGVYIAVGLSYDNKMGQDSVTECISFNNYSSYVKDSFNKNIGVNILSDKSFSTSSSASYFDSITECEWKRPSEVIHNGLDFSTLRNTFYLFVAVGPADGKNEAANGKNKHRRVFTTNYPLMFGDFKEESTEKECQDSGSFQCFGFRAFPFIEKAIGRSNSNKEECLAKSNCLIRLRILRLLNGYRFSAIGYTGINYWMAFALSADERMGDDVVFECAFINDVVMKGISWNKNQGNVKAVADGIYEREFKFENNKLSCTFEVNEKFTVSVGKRKEKFSLSDRFEYKVLFAFGKVTENSDTNRIVKEKHKATDRGVSNIKFHHLNYSVDAVDYAGTEAYSIKKNSHILIYISILIVVIAAIIVLAILHKRRQLPKTVQNAVPVPISAEDKSIETIESLKGEKVTKSQNKDKEKSFKEPKTTKTGKTSVLESKVNVKLSKGGVASKINSKSAVNLKSSTNIVTASKTKVAMKSVLMAKSAVKSK